MEDILSHLAVIANVVHLLEAEVSVLLSWF